MSANAVDYITDKGMVVRSRFMDIDGVRTHYLETGNLDGPPLVLIHGGGAGATAKSNWTSTFAEFGQDYRILAPEMVGFGGTDRPDPANYEYSQKNRNIHMAGFLSGLNLGAVPVVGNSMGGATALGVAMDHPELISDLVLMGSAGLNTAVTEDMLPILNYDFTLEGMRRLIDALTGPDFVADEAVIEERHKGSLQPETRTAYGTIMKWIHEQGGLYYEEDDIKRVKVRVLVMNGKDDKVVPLSCGYKYLELLDYSTGYIMPRTGHWIMIERPEEFARVVKSFVRREFGVSS